MEETAHDRLARHQLKLSAADAITSSLIKAAQYRKGVAFEQWHEFELQALWSTAQQFASAHGLRSPSLLEVKEGERQASGHSDYAHKLGLYIAEKMMEPARTASVEPST